MWWGRRQAQATMAMYGETEVHWRTIGIRRVRWSQPSNGNSIGVEHSCNAREFEYTWQSAMKDQEGEPQS